MDKEQTKFEKVFDNACRYALPVTVIFGIGYMVGRITCVVDFQNGKLDMFIPK